MVFLVFDSCCLIRYAETRLLGGGGKQGSRGGDMMGMSPLCRSGIWFITGLDELSLCIRVAYHCV